MGFVNLSLSTGKKFIRDCEPFSSQSIKIDKSILEQQEEKMHSLILLSLFDEVLYKVSKEKIAFVLWLKL